MYVLREDVKKLLLQDKGVKYISDTLGISFSYIVNILNRKKKCSRILAWSIVKCLDYDNEVAEYFEEV